MKVERTWETPSPEDIVKISAMHVEWLNKDDGTAIWEMAGLEHLVLRTVGRRSGKVHQVALPFWIDPTGGRLLVGSYGGGPKHPAWYFNVADREANPTVVVHRRDGWFECTASVLDGDDRAATWAALVEERPFYLEYQASTERQLPLVRLVDLHPTDPQP